MDTQDLFSFIPSANDLPQDDNPSAPSVSLPDSGAGGGWADTATKLLGTVLNYNLAKDERSHSAQLNAAAQRVATPMSASFLRTPTGGVNWVGVAVAAGAVLGLAWAAKKVLA